MEENRKRTPECGRETWGAPAGKKLMEGREDPGLLARQVGGLAPAPRLTCPEPASCPRPRRSAALPASCPPGAGSASGGSRRPAPRRPSRRRTSPRRRSAHAPRRRARSASSSRGGHGRPPAASADLARPRCSHRYSQEPRPPGARTPSHPSPRPRRQALRTGAWDQAGRVSQLAPRSHRPRPAPPPPGFRWERAQRPRRRPAAILEKGVRSLAGRRRLVGAERRVVQARSLG